MSHSPDDERVKFRVVMTSDAATKEVCNRSFSTAFTKCVCLFALCNSQISSLSLSFDPIGFTFDIKNEIVRVETNIS
jgi:hypothetical protein